MRRGPLRALLAGAGALVVACGSAPPATFHPEGANPAGPGSVAGPSAARLAQTASQKVTWPPFGGNVRVVMPAWLPADRGEIPAVITAKNFCSPFCLPNRGSQDHRWSIYVRGRFRAPWPRFCAAGYDHRILYRDHLLLGDESLPGPFPGPGGGCFGMLQQRPAGQCRRAYRPGQPQCHATRPAPLPHHRCAGRGS